MLTEREEVDEIRAVPPYGQLEVRTALIIEKDGVEISRRFRREVLDPDADVSNRGAFVRGAASEHWNPRARAAWAKRPRG